MGALVPDRSAPFSNSTTFEQWFGVQIWWRNLWIWRSHTNKHLFLASLKAIKLFDYVVSSARARFESDTHICSTRKFRMNLAVPFKYANLRGYGLIDMQPVKTRARLNKRNDKVLQGLREFFTLGIYTKHLTFGVFKINWKLIKVC